MTSYCSEMKQALFLHLIASLVHAASAQTCKVQVEQGWLQGAQLELVTGDGQYCAFQGVPYATPPVGKLRFKAPRPAQSWNGVRNATQLGSICPQYTNTGSEDCLFTNIYTMEVNPTNPLPVMVFIHGGAFMAGTGNDYGPDLIIPHGVILVTINYRLAGLGFMCIDSKDVPGNAGLKDQVESLRWVQRNIAKFGGDPDNVTIVGHSAGAASVGYHLYSPMSKGLFKRAIFMSASPMSDWVLSYENTRRAFIFAADLGLETDSPDELLDFLQNLPVEQIVKIGTPVLSFNLVYAFSGKTYPFCPTVEKDFGHERFIEAPIEELIKRGTDNAVDILVGTTDMEGLWFFANPIFDSLVTLFELYPESYVPSDILTRSTPIESLNISDRIKDFYFGTHQIPNITEKEYGSLNNYISDQWYSTKVNFFIDELHPTTYNAKSYLYKFSAVSERNYYGKLGAPYGLVGAAHLDDLFYLFNITSDLIPDSPNVDKNLKSYKIIQHSCTLWTNFVKYGNPTPDDSLGVIWPEYDSATRPYLDIGEDLIPRSQPDKESLAFWRSIYNNVG